VQYLVGTAFYPEALNIESFTTDFSIRFLDSLGDGLTFTIQGTGPFAIGSPGGGLGYGPDPFDLGRVLKIERSVAVKFDVFDNQGEGWNSTGCFTDGAAPAIPALDLSPSGVMLNSGHVLDVHLTYDGALLRMTVSDKATSPVSTFTATFPVDIPALVGDATGYVGFTGSTGGLTGVHEVLAWTYSNAK
jgi:hypothetical protein